MVAERTLPAGLYGTSVCRFYFIFGHLILEIKDIFGYKSVLPLASVIKLQLSDQVITSQQRPLVEHILTGLTLGERDTPHNNKLSGF